VRTPLASLLALLLLGANAPAAFAQEADPDTDGDALSDTAEDANGNKVMDNGETDPRNADTDGGGEADGSEVKGGRNPLDRKDDLTFDGDGDGLTNKDEAEKGTDPAKADSDADGAQDGADPFPLDDSYKLDADKDKLPDEWEATFGLPATGAPDTDADLDGDGLSNIDEFLQGTNPLSNDSDRDGVTDADELTAGTDPGESACLSYGQGAPRFADMDDHWAQPNVETLQRTLVAPYGKPILRGYAMENDTVVFLPDRPVTRFEILKMALFSTCIALLPEEQFGDVRFTDVPKRGRPRESADLTVNRAVIFPAARFGIVEGYRDGSFRPDAPVTRAEALKILLAASQLSLHPSLESEGAKQFADVPSADWFGPVIEQAVKLGLIEGYEDGTFRPHAPITRAEAAKVTHYVLLSNPLVNGYVLPNEDDSTNQKNPRGEV
jgi:hypothetical protein